MGMIYFSSFIAGGGDIVREFVVADLSARIMIALDGLIEYRTNFSPGDVAKLKYFNNSYILLSKFKCDSFEKFVEKVILFCRQNGDGIWKILIGVSDKRMTYRLMFYDRNVPAPVSGQQLEQAEKYISRRELVNRTNADLEISAMFRDKGWGFLGVRITKHPDYKKILKPGELRPEVAEILCRLSGPGSGDVFLDPFAGYGAIIAVRKLMSYSSILCADADIAKVQQLKKRFGRDKDIIIKQANATDMAWVKDNSVDKIVTDPPWGNFDRLIKVEELYPRVMRELSRVLEDNGVVIVLTARQLWEKVNKQQQLFDVDKRWDVLISGRQASIYKMRKKK